MKFRYILAALAVMTASVCAPQAEAKTQQRGNIGITDLTHKRQGKTLDIQARIVLDSLRLRANQQIYITPIVTGPQGEREMLKPVVVNGRNMHYAYLRGTLPKNGGKANPAAEVMRKNGTAQSMGYSQSVPLSRWMYSPGTTVQFMLDTCGCGVAAGSALMPGTPLNLMPNLLLTYVTPEVTELPVQIHEGRARVQFEVDRTKLHTEPYTARNGQRIDNSEQLLAIYDSVKYALTNPHVEISRIDICGYASPESPYLHNEELATGRSRALAEHLGEKYHLPSDRATYSSVPENWGEFREQVLQATDITDQQRRDLLKLIDAPAYGPSDYDAKERTLKTDPRFAQLWRTKILPEWFPRLRATKFAISTRLKPMSDPELAEIIKTQPELMSLNQMFRVARLYPEGSADFDRVIEIALRYYPDSPVANLNAAVTALKHDDNVLAAKLLEKAGDAPAAWNARGVLAARKADFTQAESDFRRAGKLPEAQRNLQLINE